MTDIPKREVTIRPASGNRPANIRIPASPANASVRGKPDVGKGIGGGSHYHVPIKPKKGNKP